MKTYARIQDGVIAELLKTDGDITRMFNPSLTWMDVTAHSEIAEGWGFDGASFTPPASPPAAPRTVTIAELQTQIATLSAQVAALAAKS